MHIATLILLHTLTWSAAPSRRSLSDNALTHVPAKIGQLTGLTGLYVLLLLHRSRYTNSPDPAPPTSRDLTCNNLLSVPAEIWMLSLQILYDTVC